MLGVIYARTTTASTQEMEPDVQTGMVIWSSLLACILHDKASVH